MHLIHRADYDLPSTLVAPIDFRDNVKKSLVEKVRGIRKTEDRDKNGQLVMVFDKNGQPVTVLREIYREVAKLHRKHNSDNEWFPNRTRWFSIF